MDNVPKMMIVSVNFSCALFSHLHFLTFEEGAGRLTRNVGKELPLFAV